MSYFKRVTIYTDGACRNNPGPGGWGAVLVHEGNIKELSGGTKHTTNNRMELTAVIKALEAMKRPSDIDVYSDSSYVILGVTKWIHGWISKGWRRPTGPIENLELWQQLYELSQKHKIQWRWLRGHSGHPMNERADELARNAIP